MKTKKILGIALAVCMTMGLTTVPAMAEDKKNHLYLVIPPLMRRMKKRISIHRTPTPAGPASAMVSAKPCSAILIPWKLNHGLPKNMKM